ncbi:hypothetical protein [Aliikangiella coralliicola]|uniref:Uncharacterized protein n=1 Tax=Aliikangiella coralliicola TaxID=2592383 RepID=A0A545TS13_9GAMM|nr:hypothetical protein [Aliikangiella coralliicola]TQV80006.1 hypothetical protein FLL46_26725 [Aliikangiella coralliicola]
MKKIISVLLVGFSGLAFAGDTVIYTTDEYCALDEKSRSAYDEQMLRAYSKKLGQKPDLKLCNQVNKENRVAQKKAKVDRWNYKFNRPYQGSARRLSKNQIAKLRAKNIKGYEL